QRWGAGIERGTIGHVDEGGEQPLELGELRPEADPAGLERLADLLQLFFSKRRLEDRYCHLGCAPFRHSSVIPSFLHSCIPAFLHSRRGPTASATASTLPVQNCVTG